MCAALHEAGGAAPALVADRAADACRWGAGPAGTAPGWDAWCRAGAPSRSPSCRWPGGRWCSGRPWASAVKITSSIRLAGMIWLTFSDGLARSSTGRLRTKETKPGWILASRSSSRVRSVEQLLLGLLRVQLGLLQLGQARFGGAAGGPARPPASAAARSSALQLVQLAFFLRRRCRLPLWPASSYSKRATSISALVKRKSWSTRYHSPSSSLQLGAEPSRSPGCAPAASCSPWASRASICLPPLGVDLARACWICSSVRLTSMLVELELVLLPARGRSRPRP